MLGQGKYTRSSEGDELPYIIVDDWIFLDEFLADLDLDKFPQEFVVQLTIKLAKAVARLHEMKKAPNYISPGSIALAIRDPQQTTEADLDLFKNDKYSLGIIEY
jgi:hypothetical protein